MRPAALQFFTLNEQKCEERVLALSWCKTSISETKNIFIWRSQKLQELKGMMQYAFCGFKLHLTSFCNTKFYYMFCWQYIVNMHPFIYPYQNKICFHILDRNTHHIFLFDGTARKDAILFELIILSLCHKMYSWRCYLILINISYSSCNIWGKWKRTFLCKEHLM